MSSLKHLRSSGMSLSESLLGGSGSAKGFGAGGVGSSGPEEPVVHKNQLRTLNGVVVPCMLNIMGIVLFLRLGWGIGQIGVVGCFIFFLVGEFASVMTVLSFSAIITNGKMEGGGSYFMLSRAMGPEFGGAIGILFYAAYAVGCCFYIVGFSTEITGTFLPDEANNFLINLAIGSGSLLVVAGIAYGGAEAFTKINIWLFVGQFGSLCFSLLAMFALTFVGSSWPLVPLNGTASGGGGNASTASDINGAWGDSSSSSEFAGSGDEYGLLLDHNGTFHAWELGRFMNNSMWSLETGVVELCNMGPCTFTLVFSVLYPSVSGIMEGANLSGDLKDPAGSIPKGTLIAILASFIFYALIIVVLAGCFDRETLSQNTMVMQDVLHWQSGGRTFPGQYIIVAGVCISTLSSALGALFGGSRVIQAIAKDKLFPCLTFFAKGTLKGDEPRRAVILTWFIAQLCLFMGDLNTIAPVLTCFFCLSYAAVNFACFVLDISGAPNFRPTWKAYSWHLSLLGTVVNLVIMFYLNGVYGVIACGLLVAIFLLLTWIAPVVEWGDVSQAIIFHQVRKYLLMLNKKKQHRKYWRPSILLISNEVNPLIEFCANLKKGGLFVLGTVMKGDFTDLNPAAQRVKKAWQRIILQAKVKAFSQIAIAPSARLGYQSIVTCHGLGAMNANTVVIPFITPASMAAAAQTTMDRATLKRAWQEHAVRLQRWPWSPPSSTPLPPIFESAEEFMGVVQDTLSAHKNVLITRHFHKLSIITRQLGGQKGRAKSRREDSYNWPEDREDSYVGATGELRDVTSYDFDNDTTTASNKGTIDMWIVGSWDPEDLGRTLSLLLQLAHIIHEKKEWKKQTQLRLLQVIDPETSIDGGGLERRLSTFSTGSLGGGGGGGNFANFRGAVGSSSGTALEGKDGSADEEVPPPRVDLSAFKVGQNARIALAPDVNHTAFGDSDIAQIVGIDHDLNVMYLKPHGSKFVVEYPRDCSALPEALTIQEEIKYNEALLRKLADSVRIEVAEVRAFHLEEGSGNRSGGGSGGGGAAPDADSSIFVRVNRLISRCSHNAVTIFFPLPPLPAAAEAAAAAADISMQSIGTPLRDESAADTPGAAAQRVVSDSETYMQNLQVLTRGLPPVVLVRKGIGDGVISTEM